MIAASAALEQAAAIRDAVLARERVRVVAGGSKPALSGGGDLSLAGGSGVLAYDPQEYTFTALAGTPLREMIELLAAEGQELPFDPPFADAGATLGGTVASGLSGPGRFRYGGVRDFLLGVRFVSGDGTLVSGGGRVVKNAAGFDLPKLMVGSLGRFGVMVELTFKVFPRPEASASLVVHEPDLPAAAAAMHALARSPHDLAALELDPPGRLLLRVTGSAEALPARLERLRAAVAHPSEALEGEADAALWREARDLRWAPEGHALVKVALAPTAVVGLERSLDALEVSVPRRYGVGGNVVHLAWPDGADRDALAALLERARLGALALTGRWPAPLVGRRVGEVFAERIVSVLDPSGRFARWDEGVPGAA